EAGAVRTVDEAFTARWIAQGGRAYADRYALDPERAAGPGRAAGGVCGLAHPRARRRRCVPADAGNAGPARPGRRGPDGQHPGHSPEDRAHLRRLAAALGLAATGSSDDHGALTGDRLGAETTDPDAYRALVAGAAGGGPRVPERPREAR